MLWYRLGELSHALARACAGIRSPSGTHGRGGYRLVLVLTVGLLAAAEIELSKIPAIGAGRRGTRVNTVSSRQLRRLLLVLVQRLRGMQDFLKNRAGSRALKVPLLRVLRPRRLFGASSATGLVVSTRAG